MKNIFIKTFFLTIFLAIFTLPTAAHAAPAIPAFCDVGAESGSGYYFESYENAEYQNDLLVIHLRLKTPYNDGRPFYSALRLNSATCGEEYAVIPTNDYPNFSTYIAPHTQNFSIRFASTTHFDIWNDETNTKEICPMCSVDIPSTLPNGNTYPYISYRAYIDGGASRITTHQYLIYLPSSTSTLPTPTCCSSVLFIPGLEGSRLFTDLNPGGTRLWEPKNDTNVVALSMNTNGTSLDQNVYTKVGRDGVVDSAFDVPNAFTNVYASFLNDLEKWKTGPDSIINDYAVGSYDWRLSLDDIANGGAVSNGKIYYDRSHPTSTPFLYQELARLAETSRSGKVTIVAHSMGGIVIKKILADLEDHPESPYHYLLDKIDTVILVATPQLGTPVTVASMLHGYDTDLYFPFIHWPTFAHKTTMRNAAEYMPGVYALLPSATYFNRVYDTLPNGQQVPNTTVVDYPGAIVKDAPALKNFLVGNGRPALTDPNDLWQPLHLGSSLIDQAAALHARIDNWKSPVDINGVPKIKVVQIAGWGINTTVKGITYVSAQRSIPCPPSVTSQCFENFFDYIPQFTIDGDNTVVTPSAVAMSTSTDASKKVETWYVDLNSYNKNNKDRGHKDILETNQILSLIQNLLQKFSNPAENLAFIASDFSTLKPDAKDDKLVRLSVHSPVSLDVYDNSGKHIGLVNNGGNIIVDEQLPNSYYVEFGEGKYLGVPESYGPFTVNLKGTGSGTFSFNLDEELGDTILATTTFADIPVTASSTASLTLSTFSTSTMLAMDVDGNGSVDVTIGAGQGLTEEELLPILKAMVNTLNLPLTKKQKLQKSLDKLNNLLDKEASCDTKSKDKQKAKCERKTKNKLGKAFDSLIAGAQKLQKKGSLTTDEAGELINTINTLRGVVIK